MSLTLFAVGISKKMVKSSEMLMDKLYAEFGAESEIEKLKFYISTGRFYSSYVKNDFSNYGFPKILYIDGRRQKIDNATLHIQDTGGLINVWVLNKKVIKNILTLDNVTPSKAAIVCDSLEDWYDNDNLRHLNGAESEYYKLNGYKYAPRNFNGVQSIYEWHMVRGLVDNKTFDTLKKYLVISPNWHVNVGTMSTTMLSAVFGMPFDFTNTMVQIKKEQGSLTLSDISKVLGNNVNTSDLSDYPTFVLDISTEFKFNTSMEKVVCTISFRSDNLTPYRILKWLN